jgi:hypothetical protein
MQVPETPPSPAPLLSFAVKELFPDTEKKRVALEAMDSIDPSVSEKNPLDDPVTDSGSELESLRSFAGVRSSWRLGW